MDSTVPSVYLPTYPFDLLVQLPSRREKTKPPPVESGGLSEKTVAQSVYFRLRRNIPVRLPMPPRSTSRPAGSGMGQ